MTSELSSTVIRYAEISSATKNIDTSITHRVLLTNAQAGYFRRHLLMMCGLRRRAANEDRLEWLKFHALQITMLFRFPRLLELGLFYAIDDDTLERVTFSEVGEGTLVTFNAASDR